MYKKLITFIYISLNNSITIATTTIHKEEHIHIKCHLYTIYKTVARHLVMD